MPPIEELRAVKVTKVIYMKPKVGEGFYEVSVSGRNVARVFVTRDDQLRKEAESIEGTEHYVCIRWRWGVNAERERVAIMESIAMDDNPALFN